MKLELFKEKNEFIATLELALLRDERSGVEDIAYVYKPEYDDEYINVHFPWRRGQAHPGNRKQ